MPCNSDHMEPDHMEVELSRVACLLDELNGKHEVDPAHWKGYHPDVYGKTISKAKADAMVAKLCSRLQKRSITTYSLEMQIWWRDHQKADRKRIEESLQKSKTDAARKAAIKKLTPYERRLLGLK